MPYQKGFQKGKNDMLPGLDAEVKMFNQFVNKVIRENERKDMPIIIKKLAFDLLGRIIVKTPVDTGRARAGWFKSAQGLGLPWYDEGKSKILISMGKVQGSFKDRRRNKRNPYVEMTNSVHYILSLEYGYSKQAPSGMVRVAMREMQNLVPDTVIKQYQKTWLKQSRTLWRRKKKPSGFIEFTSKPGGRR